MALTGVGIPIPIKYLTNLGFLTAQVSIHVPDWRWNEDVLGEAGKIA